MTQSEMRDVIRALLRIVATEYLDVEARNEAAASLIDLNAQFIALGFAWDAS